MASGDNTLFEIDGSTLEGGGQILRNSISLACILKKSVYINKIRAGRKTPGLSNQHLAGIQLASQICQGKLSHCKVGSQEITFHPGCFQGGNFSSNINTAGSTSLLAQIAVPILFFCDSASTLSLTGGTDVDFAPPIDFYNYVFSHYVKKMGLNLCINLKQRGFFPKGQGSVSLEVQPANSISPIVLTDRGEIYKICLRAYVAGALPINMAYEMQEAAEKVLKKDFSNIPIEAKVMKEDSQKSFGNGSGIFLTAETSTGCILASSSNGRRGVSAEEVGKSAAENLVEELKHSGCVDSHMQDQLIIFMALADGESTIHTGPITLHTRTAIFVSELLTQAKFSISDLKDKANTYEMKCSGIGFHTS